MRANDTSWAKKAFARGLQFASPDFSTKDPRIGPYEVKLPGGVSARSNPVSPADGTADELE